MFTKLERWREARQATKRLIREIRRSLQLLEPHDSNNPQENLSDREIMILAANVGLSILQGQCALIGALPPNAVCERVVEVPLYKT